MYKASPLWNQISLEGSHYTGYYFMLSYKLFRVIKQSLSWLDVFAVADPEVHAETPCNFIQMPLLGIRLLIVIQSFVSPSPGCAIVCVG